MFELKLHEQLKISITVAIVNDIYQMQLDKINFYLIK